jgi:primosomal protein N' (replication factor Y) (superfamily II helicase)
VRVVRVALDVPLPTLFDYTAPADAPVQAGQRVLVPFGRGCKVGVVLEVDAEPQVALGRIKSLAHVFRDEPALESDVIELLRFSAEYYHYPVGQVVMGQFPQFLRRARLPKAPDVRVYRLSAAGHTFELSSLPQRAALRRRLLMALRDAPTLDLASARALSPAAPRALAELERIGLIERVDGTDPEPAHRCAQAINPPSGPALTPDQAHSVRAILDGLDRFAPFLLRGVTGSGKTEVYFAVVAEVLARRRQALILVPEINLTPQLIERFRARFPDVARAALHSNLADGERLRAWRDAQAGRARVVIGTRLAVFTPLPELGLVIVDEEHDASFKQQDGLRYSARDLALMRAKRRAVPAVLGSATPSLESYANARAGRYALLSLPSRPGATLPRIRCVDTRRERLRHGLSQALVQAIAARLSRGEQSLVFVNRRGYAPALVCPACGWASPCTRCSAHLVLHLKERRLRCHYCGHEESIAALCAACGNQDLAPAGHGTQRLESALAELFPTARLLRVDRDSTRRRHAFATMQEDIRAQRIDLLVGTQMLAKGHDFPQLTLVGVVNADSALFSSDFRAAERLYALLTQVAGRAGRGGRAGEVLIQTEFPDHPVYDAVCRQDYAAFAEAALEERRQCGFPPYCHQALLRAEAARRALVDEYLQSAVRAAEELGMPVQIFDPVPPAIERVAGRERGQLLVQAEVRGELQRFLSAWLPRLGDAASRSVRWSLEVDPLEV